MIRAYIITDEQHLELQRLLDKCSEDGDKCGKYPVCEICLRFWDNHATHYWSYMGYGEIKSRIRGFGRRAR